MRLTDHIYLVAGGKWSFGLTHPLDCSVYLIDTGDGCILVDAGCGLEPERIRRELDRHGFSVTDVHMIVLTHYHADHACGAAGIAALAHCPVYAPEPEAAAVAVGDDVATSLAPGRGKSYPADFVYPPCPGVIGLSEGDALSHGSITLTAHLVPGHSLSDLVLYGQIDGLRCLFSGDAIFAGGEILLQSLYDVSILPYAEAVKRLAALPVDALFPGHGQFVLSGGDYHVQRCAEAFASGLVPKQFHYFT